MAESCEVDLGQSAVAGEAEGGEGCGKEGRYGGAWASLSARLSRPPTQAELAREVGVSRQAVSASRECAGLEFSNGRLLGVRWAGVRERFLGVVGSLRELGEPVTCRSLMGELGLSEGGVRAAANRYGVKLEDGRPHRGRRAELVARYGAVCVELGRLPSGVEFVKLVVGKSNSSYIRWARVLGLALIDGRKLK